MRQSHPEESLSGLCALFGVTRQAYYEAEIGHRKTSVADMIVLRLVNELRSDIPMLGTRKLLFMLAPELKNHGIKIGRDQLFQLLRFHGLLVRRRNRSVKTTNSHHWLKRFPDLTVELAITHPEQLWVSDITYIRTLQGFSYLSLITDAFSRKIVGHCLLETLETIGPLEALSMAKAGRQTQGISHLPKLIHHSDRGIQYCCGEYVDALSKGDIAISMTQNGSPYENALAERMNGILKNEFFPMQIYKSHEEAKRAMARIISLYNERRPHSSIDYFTPSQAHVQNGVLAKRWKPKRKATPDDDQVSN